MFDQIIKGVKIMLTCDSVGFNRLDEAGHRQLRAETSFHKYFEEKYICSVFHYENPVKVLTVNLQAF